MCASVNRNTSTRDHKGTRLVKILERPAGQQFAPFQGLLESGIAVGYVFLPGAQFVACKLAPQPIWASRAHPRWACRSPPAAHGSEASPAARNTLDSAWIPRASKLLICGLFQKGRVLAQDGVRHHGSEENTLGADDCKAHGPWPGRKHRHSAADLWSIIKGRFLAQDAISSSLAVI